MKRRTFAAFMVAALLPLTASTLAAADPIIWRPAPCATGEITQHTVDTGYPKVNLAGWIQPCPDLGLSGQTNGYSFMYHAPYANVVLALHPYESIDAPTSFIEEVSFRPADLAPWDPFGGLRGVCLVRSYEHRLSCVVVESGPDGTPVVTPAAPDDPRLWAPRLGPPGPGGQWIIQPNCGTCALVTNPNG